eukprot:792397-Karenia_brevis.AAC.1
MGRGKCWAKGCCCGGQFSPQGSLNINGDSTLSTLYDMENLYDNTSIPALVREANRLDYPSLVLKLGLQMHMACRSIRCYQFHPGVTTPANGIIAGCTQSTTFAKILLHAIIQQAYDTEVTEALARGMPRSYATTLRTFVDDISNISRGRDTWVLQAQRSTSSSLLKGLEAAKCKISKKTAIIGSRKHLVDTHQKHLEKIGLKAKTPNDDDDDDDDDDDNDDDGDDDDDNDGDDDDDGDD